MPRNKSTLRKISTVEFDYKRFGQIVRVLIKQKGFTQANFAESINISTAYLNNILAGTRRASLEIYYKILDVLQINDIVCIYKAYDAEQFNKQSSKMTELIMITNHLTPEEIEVVLNLAKNMVEISSKSKK